MASADNYALPLSDPDTPVSLPPQGSNALFNNILSSSQSPALPANHLIQEDAPEASASLCEESEVPTSTNSPASTPRVTSKRRKRIAGTKPKRVRTGCLTCRERHLKCDEASHRCQNCRKSGRLCRRGVRLNFIDTQTVAPPHYIPRPPGIPVTFRDDSRTIASEYVGGEERYPPLGMEPSLDIAFPPEGSLISPSIPLNSMGQSGSPSHGIPPAVPPDQGASYSPFKSVKDRGNNVNNRVYLNNPQDILLLQVFVEQVGQWMDSMDTIKHFTQILPFHALEQPMLLKAFMACGARHLYLVNSAYGEEKASYFHDMASQDLLGSLRDPDRDSALCATTAVVLNVYELMSSRSIHDMNHIAGARALIKECHWDAKSPGLGGACFWLNVSMELLICMRFNWSLAWEPDTWGLDMNMDAAEPRVAGDEEMWTHRIVYICAKVADFRSLVSQTRGLNSRRSDQQHREWNTYSDWCDQWAKAAPRSMMPLGYLHPWETSSKSHFPEIWLIKRSAIVARLFYHATRLMLARSHPSELEFSPEMQQVQQIHAHDICGIVAHVKDRGVASFSIQFLVVAAECLVMREAQEEVIQILDKIVKETGCPAEHIKQDLQQTWGWPATHQEEVLAPSTGTVPLVDNHGHLHTAELADSREPHGAINPIMAYADFSMEIHPYQEYYVAPHHTLHEFTYETF
ncbi:Zn(II)2Cys6 transcription factor domain-containing protein [Aspergillus clavatus NRRL 1]|uniref:Zn(2)-C6 fungal-type domain-containing protein n=1 Tax=Aspergillus clavatus (strain ATCC 1007 / CBS 513.65 / DSM 816 / NCTC 3887 / NRRL 1 / QM 1276 / 107) TaxID=344612 RepID=A1CB57_ASPCL|nr:uncharacterized protein ACLA_014120 [Aspergillus clavatus NRRL 1]EAW12975.1 conserved hypothetical protein [Aspergillus clavatus NRRL 1]